MMRIVLQPEQEQFVRERLKGGKYNTVDDLIVEAFRLLEEREEDYRQWLEITRNKVEEGIQQLDRGEGLDGEEVFKEILAELDETGGYR